MRKICLKRIAVFFTGFALSTASCFAAGVLGGEGQGVLLRKVTHSLLVILVGYLLAFILINIVNRRVKDIKSKHLTRKGVVYFFTMVILVSLALMWLRNIGSVTVIVSVIGAGIALALQEALLCMAGWFLIVVRRPFQIGDRVELGGVKGDVIDIRLFQTSLLEIGNWVDADQSTGRIVNIPNSAVFKKENFNYNQGFEFIWNEIKIQVTFESDWKRAEEIMIEHGKGIASGKEDLAHKKINFMTKRYMIKHGKLTPIVYVNIKESGVELTLRYLTEAKARRNTQDALCREILSDFRKEGKVTFAYPTYRIVR
ncbi:MAG: mechanosensitive ion channel family protein [Candidatus Omnitrophica bacterium]|nr:mechanosensitive ion channel family protein [Candidatus Omnitrophota bacterium]